MRVYPVTPFERKRRSRGLTQWDLARLSGIVQSRLSLIERGLIKPKPEELRELCRILDLSETDFHDTELAHG